MDNSDYSRNRGNDYLGVNKIGKNIRKSPVHQPSFANPARQPPQPQVYNINKNDFQSIVQQLTGSPSRHSQEPVTRPPLNAARPPSMRMQRSRPSPLTPLNVARPRMPAVHHAPPQQHMPVARPVNNNNSILARPPPPYHGQPRAPPGGGDHTGWSNTAESPISAYMRYLQHSIVDPAQGQSQMQGQHQQQSSGLLPYPLVPPLPSPRKNGSGPPQPPLPSQRMNGPPLPPPLPSPTSQFLLPSPSGYLNLLSPRSPYPLLSPGYQNPPPSTPNFSFSPMTQHGAFGPGPGPGPGPQPPPSPGMGFPSPGFFSILSPRWRD
ncbi:protein HAIKU1-like [Bidens hawaiensis]|uniref:protein HAIKU1-like n=1 Tax=Bidens hawaiensis TaxID=980011 RepID=UPI00404AE430